MKDNDGLFSFRLAWVILIAAVATLALGAWGWLALGRPLDDALYRAIALFDINNDAYATGDEGMADWRFRIGRWIGAGVVFSSLLALAALLREHLATEIGRAHV